MKYSLSKNVIRCQDFNSDIYYTIEYKEPIDSELDGTWSCFRNESNELRFCIYEGIHLGNALKAIKAKK